jgi:hypothetical protein
MINTKCDLRRSIKLEKNLNHDIQVFILAYKFKKKNYVNSLKGQCENKQSFYLSTPLQTQAHKDYLILTFLITKLL